MNKVDLTQLIEAGAHFGHLTRRWNPKMKPYIFMEKNGIHESADMLAQMVSVGKKVLFVGTKKQAKGIIETEAKRCNSNWVSERWLGGMLTNFSTIRKSIKRLNNIEKQETDGTFDKITKKERLFLTREKDKLKKVLEGVESMSRLPAAQGSAHGDPLLGAIKEAQRLNIPVFAIVDTNCDPDPVDYIIPANDDAVKTIELIVKYMADAVIEGENKAKEIKAEEAAEAERIKKEKEQEKKEEEQKAAAAETNESEKAASENTVKEENTSTEK